MKRSIVLSGLLALASCKQSLQPPVRTLNEAYRRETSRVLVREVGEPTRANLDYAAYAANLFFVDTAKTEIHPGCVSPDSLAMGGFLADFRTSLESTPLSDSERVAPMAWKPVEDLLLSWSFDSAGPLVTRIQELSQKRWGDTSGSGQPLQQVVALHLHRQGDSLQAWVRIEFSASMAPHLMGIGDRDGDGHAELWARIAGSEWKAGMAKLLGGDYSRRVLVRDEAIQWANELGALWYPTWNTDMVDLAKDTVFPLASTEPEVVAGLSGLKVARPLAVLRGRPFGIPLYLVIAVPSLRAPTATSRAVATGTTARTDSSVKARLDSIQSRIGAEVASHGGSWEAWVQRTAAVRAKASSLEYSDKPEVQAFVGPGKTLLFRRELSYLGAGDLAALPDSLNPVGAIRAFRDSLAARGIDFLFVPVPTKIDLDPTLLGGSKDEWVQPWARKALADLARAGVETVDLWPELRGHGLWRLQDTHWKPGGAKAAADRLAVRIRQYPWFAAVAKDSTALVSRDTTWQDFGDLRGRLPEAKQGNFPQEIVRGEVFRTAQGKPWEEPESSPILLLGDSYLGVYQKVAPRGGGFSAYLSRGLQVPVSVIMGWGGGPEAPRKLADRGPEALQGRRLVVWTMSVRDLFCVPGGWKAP